MIRRKICMVTGSRADYGLLCGLMKGIQQDAEMELQVIATGMHLSPEFGLTYQGIEEDGFVIDARVEMLLSSDTAVGMTKSIGLGVIGFADALDRLRPDILVLLGDRFEILAAAQAALGMRIPVAHIHGGETTEGAIDEAIRHAVTKMSHLHFVAAERYRQRVLQLGERPDRVFNVGAPGLEGIHRRDLLEREDLEKSLSFKLGKTLFLVTYHPVTLSDQSAEHAMRALLGALDHFPEAKIIFTRPNADTGGRIISRMIDHYGALQPGRVMVSTSLGQRNYLSAMKLADVVIGNSSSGLIEAPAVKRPTVNLGDRQKGRLKALSVIDCSETEVSIVAAITRALSPEFQRSLPHTISLYGDGNASSRIKEVLKTVPLEGILQKAFNDMG